MVSHDQSLKRLTGSSRRTSCRFTSSIAGRKWPTASIQRGTPASPTDGFGSGWSAATGHVGDFDALGQAFGAINSGYATPYRSSLGQTILALLAGLYIGLMLWIRALSLPEKLPRLLRLEGDK